MFHSVVSGCTIWTSYEVITMWAFANDFLPFLSWEASPFLFVALFLVIPIFRDAHFYLVHRILHFKFLYKHVHALHHKNIDIGPWSGLAMHPIEHLLYFSGVLNTLGHSLAPPTCNFKHTSNRLDPCPWTPWFRQIPFQRQNSVNIRATLLSLSSS